MVATVERRRSFTAIKGGVETAWDSTPFAGGPVNYEPVDLVLLDTAGWRGLASGLSWDDDYRRSLDELVDRWLTGIDRRRLLEIAAEQSSGGLERLDFKALVVAWLDPPRLGRLVSLVQESKHQFLEYPVCYALGKAFTAVDITVEHYCARPEYSDDELMLVLADDASTFDDGDFAVSSSI